MFETEADNKSEPRWFNTSFPCVPDVVLLCFSLINRESFDHIENYWHKELSKREVDAPIVLVGTNLHERGVVDMDMYFDGEMDDTSIKNREHFVTRNEGLDMMKRIGAISYIEFSEKVRDRNELLYNVTQAALFHKSKSFKNVMLSSLKQTMARLFGWSPTVPTPPPLPPFPCFSPHPELPVIVRLGPFSVACLRGHDRSVYGCLRHITTGIMIYYYIKKITTEPVTGYLITVVVTEDPFAEGSDVDHSETEAEEEEDDEAVEGQSSIISTISQFIRQLN